MLYFHSTEQHQQQHQNENIFAARELLDLFFVIMVATFSTRSFVRGLNVYFQKEKDH